MIQRSFLVTSSMVHVSRSIYTVTRIKSDIAEFTTNGIPYYFDNRVGKWSVWNLSLFLDGAETEARQSSVFINGVESKAYDRSPVMKKLVTRIDPKVFRYSFLDKPNFRITTELTELGKTSYNLTTKLLNPHSKVLVERFAKLVWINNETRRPVENSRQVLNSFSHLKNGSSSKLSKTEIPETPYECFKWHLTTRYSDLDTKMHANQSLYIKSCFDCATDAAMNRKLALFTGDMTWYPVKYFSIDYLGESFANDNLTVNMWQNEDDISTLHFSIFNNHKKLSYLMFKLDMDKMKS